MTIQEIMIIIILILGFLGITYILVIEPLINNDYF